MVLFCRAEDEMERWELVELIRGGVPDEHASAPVVWADMGAGTGNFTRALETLLAPRSTIYAVDRDRGALKSLERVLLSMSVRSSIRTLHADFLFSLDLPPLDGVLMANSLHFYADHNRVLTRVVESLRPGGRLLLVEYDVMLPCPSWIPYPAGFKHFVRLAREVNLSAPQLVGTRRSKWSVNRQMYAAVACRVIREVATHPSE